MIPKVKTGLDLGLDLGGELGGLLAEIVTDGVEYVNDDYAAYKRLEAAIYEATALNAQAEFIEQSMKNLHALARAAVCSAAAAAIEHNRRSDTAAKSASTAALRRALSEVSSADADHGVFLPACRRRLQATLRSRQQSLPRPGRQSALCQSPTACAENAR